MLNIYIGEFMDNMLNKHSRVQQEFRDLSKYANQYFSWETYFERLIVDVTSKEPYKHSHSSKTIQHCYVDSCLNCNPYIAKKCNKYVSENKILWLLRDTKYERLLLLC